MSTKQTKSPSDAARLDQSSETQNDLESDLWERRNRQRFQRDDSAILRRSGGTECRVELVDLSEDGAGVWSSVCIVPGEHVELLLPGRRSGPLVIVGVVVDRKSLGAGTWRLSLKFPQRLRPEELVAALD